MARIRGRGNKETEIALVKLLRVAGIAGWRRQQVIRVDDAERRAGTARPTNVRADFIFPKQRLVVFVDGCFWHGCPQHSPPVKWLRRSSMAETARSFDKLRMTTRRRTGKAFWRAKLAANKRRDRFVTRSLRRQGWTVIRIWEHELATRPRRCIERIKAVTVYRR